MSVPLPVLDSVLVDETPFKAHKSRVSFLDALSCFVQLPEWIFLAQHMVYKTENPAHHAIAVWCTFGQVFELLLEVLLGCVFLSVVFDAGSLKRVNRVTKGMEVD